MKIVRDTLTRKMGVSLAEEQIRDRAVSFDKNGKLIEIGLAVSDNEKFNYRVTIKREELRELLDEYAKEDPDCPF